MQECLDEEEEILRHEAHTMKHVEHTGVVERVRALPVQSKGVLYEAPRPQESLISQVATRVQPLAVEAPVYEVVRPQETYISQVAVPVPSTSVAHQVVNPVVSQVVQPAGVMQTATLAGVQSLRPVSQASFSTAFP